MHCFAGCNHYSGRYDITGEGSFRIDESGALIIRSDQGQSLRAVESRRSH